MVTIIKIVSFISLSFLCAYLYPYLNPTNIAAFIEKNKLLAPLVFILITSVRPVLFFLPSMGLTIVAGILFGKYWGTAYVVLGGALSTVVGYYFAQWFGRNTAKKLIKKNSYLLLLEKKSTNNGKNMVLYMRLFNLPWDLVSYWAGVSGINFKDFYIASMIPIVPISFLYTYFGSKVFKPACAGFFIALTIMFALGAIPFVRAKLKGNSYV